MPSSVYIGIDLALMKKKPSTVSILKGKTIYVKDIQSIRGIVELINNLQPKCIAIDSPLQLPRKGAYRDCDIQMKKMGLKPLPVTWRYMKELTMTAIELKRNLEGFDVIETFPTGALELAGLTRYGKSKHDLFLVFVHMLAKESLKLGTEVIFNKDILDSLICTMAAKHYGDKNADKYVEIRGKECKIIIPII